MMQMSADSEPLGVCPKVTSEFCDSSRIRTFFWIVSGGVVPMVLNPGYTLTSFQDACRGEC